MLGEIIITVPQAKRLIAAAVLRLPQFEHALKHGKIVLKSGTTVSAIGELLGVPPLRIGGRIVPGGARAAKFLVDAPHLVVIDKGKWRKADQSLPEEMALMGANDLFVTGANALDSHGVAGLLAGLESGSTAGKSISNLASEGIPVIIAVGLEKLIPGSILELSQLAGRKRITKAMGMAVGLIPIFGKVITEKEAIEILTSARCTVIAAGGLNGAEGATVMLVEGSEEQVDAAIALVSLVKDTSISGDPHSLQSCEDGGPYCSGHLACIYKAKCRAERPCGE